MPDRSADGNSIEPLAPRLDAIRSGSDAIAEAVRSCGDALACALWWRFGAAEGLARSAGSNPRWEAVAETALRALAQRIEPAARSARAPATDLLLKGPELSALCGKLSLPPDTWAFALLRKTESAEVRIVVLAASPGREPAMRALADLGCGAALSALTAEEKEASRAFWRKRAIEAGDKHSRARAELDALDKEHRAARKALEAELAQERALVRRLALRMFAAIDEERSRIARDLHDDQAQLLAAARIALEGGRDEARAIFKRLEQELRRKIRELRPAALGDQTLEDALRGEFKRLAEAGIEANLSRGVGAATLSRPVQQLCFQIAREALSNVLRHSRASRVEVGIERKGAVATISIADNGRGIDPGADRRGTGLAGLAERLQLMGGIVRIDSRPGATKLVAEIPEPV